VTLGPADSAGLGKLLHVVWSMLYWCNIICLVECSWVA